MIFFIRPPTGFVSERPLLLCKGDLLHAQFDQISACIDARVDNVCKLVGQISVFADARVDPVKCMCQGTKFILISLQ